MLFIINMTKNLKSGTYGAVRAATIGYFIVNSSVNGAKC